MGQCRTKQIMLNLVTLRWWELTESADDADWATLKVAVQKIKWEAEFGMSQANNACFEKKQQSKRISTQHLKIVSLSGSDKQNN